MTNIGKLITQNQTIDVDLDGIKLPTKKRMLDTGEEFIEYKILSKGKYIMAS